MFELRNPLVLMGVDDGRRSARIAQSKRVSRQHRGCISEVCFIVTSDDMMHRL